MENVTAPGMSESLLNAAKMEISTACDQSMDLVSKIEMVDNQSDVHLENSNSQHLLETQYINIQRVSDLTKNLTTDSIPPELLSHHVVDLGANPEYSQHVVTNAPFYDNSDFLSTNFSEEDRRLTAALVAVKFIQQDINPSTSSSLSSELLHDKQTLPAVSSISTDKVITSIVPNYVQAVESRSQADLSIHISNHPSMSSEQHLTKEVDQHGDQIIKLYQPLLQSENKTPALPPLKKISQSLSSRSAKYISAADRTHTTDAESLIPNADLNVIQRSSHQMTEGLSDGVKSECDVSSDLNASSDNNEMVVTDDYDSEADDARSSQKSLPHKKRIPNKLKRALTTAPTRNIHAKCYKCTKCGEQFPNQATFNAHKIQQHSSKKANYSCELCNKTCANQLKFFEHLKSHYEPSMNAENIRNSSANGDYEQDAHSVDRDKLEDIQINDSSSSSTIFNNGESNLTCGKCGRVFRRQKAFDCHMSLSHPKQEDIEEFSEPEDMMEGIRHVVNMVPAGDEEDKNFEPWESPKMENGVIHQTPQSTQTSVKSDASLVTAIEVKSEEVDDFDEDRSNTKARKQLSCPHCERTFIHRNSLLYHIRSHTGHRPHQCELCGKSFFAAGALKIHMRLHSGDKPYKCEYCGRFFRQWGDLKYHITSIHSNTKMFQCEYCGKDFARKYSLVVHRRIHTGEKNYICEFCTKTFRAASYLQNHRRIHTGEKPHMCEVCGKPFRVRSDMKRHMKTHGDVSVVNVLTDLSNGGSDNSSQDVRNSITCLVDNQEVTVIEKHEDTSNNGISDQESDHNSKQIVTAVAESAAPLNLNVKPVQTTADGLYNYSREEDLVDRENSGTLYVWIQTNQDTILPDS
ncbi:zinc finger protein 845 isoform X2 [Planococcus citri]